MLRSYFRWKRRRRPRTGLTDMIDSMLRRRRVANACELCETKQATQRATFTAHFLHSEPTPLMIEEHVAKTQLEKRVCDNCAEQLRSMKNVTDLTLESL